MGIRVDDEKVTIDTSPVDSVRGAQPEPEERPALHILETGVQTQLLNPSTGGVTSTGKELPAKVTRLETVGQIAREHERCGRCRHFDRAKWQRTLEHATQSVDMADQHGLNSLRAIFGAPEMPLRPMRPEEVNTPLRPLGVCAANYKFLLSAGWPEQDAIIVCHPQSQCATRAANGLRLPRFFAPLKRGLTDQFKSWLFNLARGRRT